MLLALNRSHGAQRPVIWHAGPHTLGVRAQRNCRRFNAPVSRKIKTILLCKHGHETEVVDDIRLANEPGSVHCSVHPGWVETTSPSEIKESSWALQTMPDIKTVSAKSSSNLAIDASKIIISVLKPLLASPISSSSGAKAHRQWHWHALPATGTPWQSKVKPLESRIGSLLSSSPVGKYRASGPRKELHTGDILVQCFLKSEDTLTISIATMSRNQLFWLKPVPWLSGVSYIPQDDNYPAESFKKCKEILKHMGIAPKTGLEGKTVVELGANPGGWTLVLLEAGARLTSVDWADLQDPRFKAHPMLTHRCEDARLFNPLEAGIIQARNGLPSSTSDTASSPAILENVNNGVQMSLETIQSNGNAILTEHQASEIVSRTHVDYLFADLALPPEKSLLTFNHWLEERWTQAFAWTFKFGFHPPSEKYAPMIHKIRSTLQAHGPNLEFSIRHLSKHENEIVVLGGWKSPL